MGCGVKKALAHFKGLVLYTPEENSISEITNKQVNIIVRIVYIDIDIPQFL
jgi:hypothetical protein